MFLLMTNRLIKGFVITSIFCANILLLNQAWACPLIDGLVDMNCDGIVKLSMTGDSIVRGTGDNVGSSENSGWVFRLKEIFPEANIQNVGVPGVKTKELRHLFIKNLVPGEEAYNEMRYADYVIIEVGTNDFFNDKPASFTVSAIKRLVDTLRDFYTDTLGATEPIFVVAVPPTSRRSFQNPFLKSLASELMKKKTQLNVLVRFDKLGQSIISKKDHLHPSPKGYERMAEFISAVILGKLQEQALELRPDTDQDGIYDLFESEYGTDPALADTDSDGASDGDEVFVNFTDPLDALSF